MVTAKTRCGIGRAHAIVERDARVIVAVLPRTDIQEHGLPCREMRIGMSKLCHIRPESQGQHVDFGTP